MKFSFKEPHLWRQHALSLISKGEYEHALSVLKEVIHLEPNTSVNCLLAAKLCFEHLNMPGEGTVYSELALKRETIHSSGLLSRCHLYLGLGFQLQAQSTLPKSDRTSLNNSALENFQV